MTNSTVRSPGPGRPRNSPADTTTQLAIRLTATDRESLKTLASQDGIALSTYVIKVLRAHIRGEQDGL